MVRHLIIVLVFLVPNKYMKKTELPNVISDFHAIKYQFKTVKNILKILAIINYVHMYKIS